METFERLRAQAFETRHQLLERRERHLLHLGRHRGVERRIVRCRPAVDVDDAIDQGGVLIDQD